MGIYQGVRKKQKCSSSRPSFLQTSLGARVSLVPLRKLRQRGDARAQRRLARGRTLPQHQLLCLNLAEFKSLPRHSVESFCSQAQSRISVTEELPGRGYKGYRTSGQSLKHPHLPSRPVPAHWVPSHQTLYEVGSKGILRVSCYLLMKHLQPSLKAEGSG